MRKDQIDQALTAHIEELAAIEHERWSHWQRYLHEKGQRQLDGSIVLPAEFVAHWDKQMSTEYADLSNEEKESDREQVRRYLPVVTRILAERRSSS